MSSRLAPSMRRRLGAAVVLALAVLLLFELPDLFPLRRFGTDGLQWLAAAPTPSDPDLVLVAIDDASLEAHGSWPFNRRLHARLVERLTAAEARLVLFDLIFRGAAPDDGSDELARAMTRSGRVCLGYDLARDGASWAPRPPLPLLGNAALDTGFLQNPIDEDGTIRRARLVARDRRGGIIPSLSLVAAARTLEATWTLDDDGRLRLHREASSAGFGNLAFPLGMDGDVTIDFSTFGERGFPVYSFHDVLADRIPAQAFRGKTVVVGLTAPVLQDRFPTPLFGEGEFAPITPGAVIQAYGYWTLVNGRMLRHAERGRNRLVLALAVFLAALACCLLPPSRGVIVALLLPLSLLLVSVRQFQQGLLLDWSVPSLAVLVTAASALGLHTREARRRREQVQSIFGSFVPPHLVDRLVADPELLNAEGRMETRTILMADLRGFTALSAELGPRETVALLNRHFAQVSELVFRHDGMVDKFMGDAVMAVFGEFGRGNPCEQALRAALDMQDALDELNGERPDGPKLRMGIGISTGAVIVGHVGSAQKREYTVIGEPANLAARLEKETKNHPHAILCDGRTREGLGRVEGIDLLPLGAHPIRGFEAQVDLFAPTRTFPT